jgi:SM-20-related protein
MGFRLGALLDPAAIRKDFERHGFAHVAAVLADADAARIRAALLEDTPWNLVFNDRDRHIDMTEASVRSLPADKAKRLQDAIYAQAGSGFQYCYYNYPIYDAWVAGRDRGHLLHEFYEWLNQDEFLGFVREATGVGDIDFVDAQATSYRPGQFLTCHDDFEPAKNRRAAYVLNLTPDWRPDWGGYLQLLDEQGHVRRGLKPMFNVLNLLAVPQPHNVGIVAPFAGEQRLSITGWLRHGRPG